MAKKPKNDPKNDAKQEPQANQQPETAPVAAASDSAVASTVPGESGEAQDAARMTDDGAPAEGEAPAGESGEAIASGQATLSGDGTGLALPPGDDTPKTAPADTVLGVDHPRAADLPEANIANLNPPPAAVEPSLDSIMQVIERGDDVPLPAGGNRHLYSEYRLTPEQAELQMRIFYELERQGKKFRRPSFVYGWILSEFLKTLESRRE